MGFRLAHLSDPHLAPLPRMAWSDAASKRALGYLNWHRGRDEIHRRDVLDAVTADLEAQAPDHIVVTGDLTNLALLSEYEAALTWLGTLGTPDRVSVIPGNHDAYVPGALAAGLPLWTPYVRSDGEPLARDPEEMFPTLRRRGPVVLIGVSSAIETPPFFATGRVGGRQLIRLADDLEGLHREGVFRLVMIHHPLWVRRRNLHKRLADAGAARTVLRAAGAELIIHGHMHTATVAALAGPTGDIPVVGVPSASADPLRGREPAGYALYDIASPTPETWDLTITRRTMTPTGEMVASEAGRFSLPRVPP